MTIPTPTEQSAALQGLRDRLMTWLTTQALPIWWETGADRERGGFHERLALDGSPCLEPRRARVQARQVFAYAVAGRLGWSGPSRQAVEHGLAFFRRAYERPDGTFRTLVGPDGATLDDSVVLYDQAFALFALAVAGTVVADPAPLTAAATRLRQRLEATLKHPLGGFEEASPRKLPLLANPHMHLLEASLAWVELGSGPDQPAWHKLADEIAELSLSRFIDPATGYLREFFDGEWRPAPGRDGRIVEPGHLFEWAWLLVRWGRLRGRDDAIAAARRMAEAAEATGVDPIRNVAVNAILDDGAPVDSGARLWPQTERIKAAVALAGIAATDQERALWRGRIAAGVTALLTYLDVPVPGLWRDKLQPDGSFVEEPAPASSFYHIICAIEELEKAFAAGALDAPLAGAAA
ncbi:AGE family epimerase/isomerase [Inquilinus limosus]|uniref:AGE family epimerase/isomerase n=1 Tax=Inquilinus limosus TaxID=171674 RepID=UPI0004023563|nr:AGE family epimerase/isomerase [Inquilinus limosus]